MTMDPEAHAARFDEKADEYDDGGSPEYRACVQHVVEHARDALGTDDVVLDLGTGTGAIALRLADDAGRVVGRDVSEGMLAEAREKAHAAGHENVEFGEGRFREPAVDADIDVVVSNFAMHHLSDPEKREAIGAVADLGPRRFVLGDVMLSAPVPDGEEQFSREVDEPATVGVLAEALTDAGFVVSRAKLVGDQFGVLVADRPEEGG